MNSLKDAQKKCLKRLGAEDTTFCFRDCQNILPMSLLPVSLSLPFSFPPVVCISPCFLFHSCSRVRHPGSTLLSFLQYTTDQRSQTDGWMERSSNALVTRLLTIQVCLTTFTLPARFHQESQAAEGQTHTQSQAHTYKKSERGK